jgi:hypothetical protein
MPTKSTIFPLITLLVFLSISISAGAGGGCQDGTWIGGDYDIRSETIKRVNNPLSGYSIAEKQRMIESIDEQESGLQRAKRECEVSKIASKANPKLARVAKNEAKEKIKLQEVVNRLVTSLKNNKDFDIQVMEVYELGEFSKEIGLDLNSTPSPDIPMTVKYDKDKIAKIDISKINSEAEQAKLDLPRLSQEVENIENQFDENIKVLDTKYDMSKLYTGNGNLNHKNNTNNVPWYTPITDFFNNIFSSVSKLFSSK